MDRLKDLKRSSDIELYDTQNNTEKKSAGISNNKLGLFFTDIDNIKENIKQIKDSVEQIKSINQSIVHSTTSDEEEKYNIQLEFLVKSTNIKAKYTKEYLQRIKDGIKNDNKFPTEHQIRENLVNILIRKFIEIMNEYQHAQISLKNQMKKKEKRQVQIIKPNATSEEIDNDIRHGNNSTKIMKSIILSGPADAIVNTHNNIVDKHQDVLILESSIRELNQMFMDLALLVDNQGEFLDQIEQQVKQASDYIDSANQDMAKSIDYQKKIRYRQCCIVIIVVIILAIIIGVIVAKVG